MNDIHTCSYSCERPACIKVQRDELAARILTQPAAAQEAVAWQRRYKNHDEWFNISKSTYTATVASKWSEKYDVRALYAAPVTAAPGIDLEQFRKLSRDMRKFIDNWDTISIDEFAHFSMRLDEMIDASAEREGS